MTRMNIRLRTSLAMACAALVAAIMMAGCKKSSEPPAPASAAELAAAKPYPLKVCLVSGEQLDSMGEPVAIVHNGQTIKFCCKDCVTDFKENTEKYLAKLTEAPAVAVPETPAVEAPKVPEVPKP